LERKIFLRAAGKRVLATLMARPYGTDQGFVEHEFDVTDQLPALLASLKGPEEPPGEGGGDD
jgi:hypothetical protein